MVLSGYMVLYGQPVGTNTPWCVITATGSVGEIDCPHTSYPVSQRRTAEYPVSRWKSRVCDTNSGQDFHSDLALVQELRAPRGYWDRNHPWVRQAIPGHHLQTKRVALRW